jgi:hypothetical protein
VSRRRVSARVGRATDLAVRHFARAVRETEGMHRGSDRAERRARVQEEERA